MARTRVTGILRVVPAVRHALAITIVATAKLKPGAWHVVEVIGPLRALTLPLRRLTVPNPNGARGSRFELDLVRALEELNLPNPVRPRQTGNRDVGDIHIGDDVTVQAKDWASMAAALTEGVAGAERQALAANRPYGIAVVKRRGRHAREAYVAMTLPTFVALYLRGA